MHLRLRIGTLICAAVLGIPLPANALLCPAEVRLIAPVNELPPFINGNGSELASPPGLIIEWAHTTVKKLDCADTQVRVIRVPTLRAFAMARNGEADIVTVTGARPAHLEVLRFPLNASGEPNADLAFMRGDVTIYARVGHKIHWDGGKKLDPQVVVGVVRGQVSSHLAKARGWKFEEAASDLVNFRKLEMGRVDVVLGQRITTDVFLSQHPTMQFVTLSPAVLEEPYYSPVNIDFFERYPDFVHAYWLQFCRLGRTHFKNPQPCKA